MYAIPVVVASVFGVLLGLVVLFRDFSQTYARAFAVVSLAAVAWVISNFFASYYFGDYGLVVNANALSYFSGYLSVVAGLVFTYTFPVKRQAKKLEKLALSVVSVGGLIFSPTTLVAGTVTVANGVIAYGVGEFAWLYAVAFLTLLGVITRNLSRLPGKVSQQRQLQAQQVLSAFLISAVLGLIVNVIFPVVGLGWQWTELSPLISIPLIGIIAYSIIRHGLFDIRVTAAKITAFLLTFAFFFGAYYYIGYAIILLSSVFSMQETEKEVVQLAFIAFLSLFGRALIGYFERLISKILFRQDYDGAQFEKNINHLVSSSTNLQELINTATYTIAHELNAASSVMAAKIEDGVASSSYGRVAALDTFLMDTVSKTISDSNVPVLTEYVSDEAVKNAFMKIGIVLYVPFVYNDELIGFLGLGVRNKGAYNERDVQVLRAVSTELAVAIQNAIYVQKIQNFNDLLKIEVDRATAELRESNQKLKQLDEMKDEFISLTSHQLRTPLTTIKGYISMLLDGDAGEVTEQQKKLLEEAFNSSQRMVHLISDFLNMSRIQSGRFELELTEVNLADILDEEIEQLHVAATSRQINLSYDKPTNFPAMQLDDSKIRQVMMNFIDNALYYSPENSTVTVMLTSAASTVEFKVIDQGIGVPKAEQHKLFTKFARASNAKKQRPDGTGIGLFMAKKVIVALGGSIIFKSEEGKGSTFGFRLNR